MTTPNPITPEVLARLRALHAAAKNPESSPYKRDKALRALADLLVWNSLDGGNGEMPALLDEVERLRARLHHECKGCPGCGSNDCPDALDVAEAEVAKLRASLTTARPLGGTP